MKVRATRPRADGTPGDQDARGRKPPTRPPNICLGHSAYEEEEVPPDHHHHYSSLIVHGLRLVRALVFVKYRGRWGQPPGPRVRVGRTVQKSTQTRYRNKH